MSEFAGNSGCANQVVMEIRPTVEPKGDVQMKNKKIPHRYFGLLMLSVKRLFCCLDKDGKEALGKNNV